MVDVFCKTLTVIPDVAASILNMAPTCRVAFTGGALGEIAVTPLKKIPGVTVGDGQVRVSYNGLELLLENLRSDGELSMNGTLLLAPSSDRVIRRADMTLNIKSEPFEKELSSLQAAFGLPLQQASPGRWYLRRTGSAQ